MDSFSRDELRTHQCVCLFKCVRVGACRYIVIAFGLVSYIHTCVKWRYNNNDRELHYYRCAIKRKVCIGIRYIQKTKKEMNQVSRGGLLPSLDDKENNQSGLLFSMMMMNRPPHTYIESSPWWGVSGNELVETVL